MLKQPLEQVSVKDDSQNEVSHEANNIDDIENLRQSIDMNPKAAIICSPKENNPNYLSIIHANKRFYETFAVNESNLIGKNYDFLFDDLDVGYSSEDKSEYVRLVKDVKNSHPCSIIATLQDRKPNSSKEDSAKLNPSKTKFKVNFIPMKDKTPCSTFIFEEVKLSSREEGLVKYTSPKADVGLLQSLERSLHNERLLREISYLIVSDSPLREISQKISKALCRYFKVDRCLIHDFRHGATSFISEYCNSYTKPMFGGDKDEEKLNVLTKYINFQNHFHKKVLNKNKKHSVIDIEDVSSDGNFLPIQDICEEFSIGAQISVITSFNANVNGGLYIHQSDKRSWSIDEVELLSTVADQLSLAIDRSDSIERVMVANHELLEKTQQLKEALKEEKNMRKTQSEFVALVSHEFKTPLQIIDSTRELLSRKIRSHNIEDPAIDKSLERIKGGIQRMNGLIHSTLNLAKMESGDSRITVERQMMDLKDFIMDIVEKNSNLASNKNIKVELNIGDLPEVFNGDPKLLDHSLTNIISNAIKYSKSNSIVKISAKTGKKKILLKIIDQGIGIPEDDLESIGQKFFRAKNSLAVAGTGIGLYLTKYFIELHGGSVLIQSEVNIGTSVGIILPRDSI